MGYFPNGTAGEAYQARYCDKCVNWSDETGCPIWTIHILHNYDAVNDETLRTVLDEFIPRDGIENDQCTMFRTGAMSRKEARFAEWLKLPIPRPPYDEWERA